MMVGVPSDGSTGQTCGERLSVRRASRVSVEAAQTVGVWAKSHKMGVKFNAASQRAAFTVDTRAQINW